MKDEDLLFKQKEREGGMEWEEMERSEGRKKEIGGGRQTRRRGRRKEKKVVDGIFFYDDPATSTVELCSFHFHSLPFHASGRVSTPAFQWLLFFLFFLDFFIGFDWFSYNLDQDHGQELPEEWGSRAMTSRPEAQKLGSVRASGPPSRTFSTSSSPSLGQQMRTSPWLSHWM